METLAAGLFDVEGIIQGAGAWGLLVVCAIVFVETGLLIGFLLPGDTLLLVTGVLTFQGTIPQPVWVVCLAVFLAAVLGDDGANRLVVAPQHGSPRGVPHGLAEPGRVDDVGEGERPHLARALRHPDGLGTEPEPAAELGERRGRVRREGPDGPAGAAARGDDPSAGAATGRARPSARGSFGWRHRLRHMQGRHRG